MLGRGTGKILMAWTESMGTDPTMLPFVDSLCEVEEWRNGSRWSKLLLHPFINGLSTCLARTSSLWRIFSKTTRQDGFIDNLTKSR